MSRGLLMAPRHTRGSLQLDPRATDARSFRLPMGEQGRLMSPREIASELLFGKVAPRWVKENAPTELRVLVGNTILFWEFEMTAWIASRRATR